MQEIQGKNTYFIPRNAEIAATYLLNEVYPTTGVIYVQERATDLTRQVWEANCHLVTTDEGKIALANALVEIAHWIADNS